MAEIKVMRLGDKIIAYIDGKMYNKEFNLPEEEINKLFEKLLNSTGDEARELFKIEDTPAFKELVAEQEKKIEEVKSKEDILDFMKDVRDNGHELFIVKGNSIYMKGLNISMPELLVREMVKAFDNNNSERVEALTNFWLWCAQNEDPRARHDLFEFLQNGKFVITKNGQFVAYRNVQVKNQGNDLLEKIISTEWLKVKKMKKSPRKYGIVQDIETGEYKRFTIDSYNKKNPEVEHIGILHDLYENISDLSEVVYTDARTRTFEIKIGEPVTQDRSKCDANPDADCSRGLHVGNKNFMHRGSFGSNGLVVLVNPKDVVAVPHYNKNKMRTCEYLPIAVAEYDEKGNLIEVDFDEFDYDLAKRKIDTVKKLSELSKTQLEEYKINEFLSPEISIEELKNIYKEVSMSLEQANKLIQDRKIN